MDRRDFLTSVGAGLGAAALGCGPRRVETGAAASAAAGGRKLSRIGIQLYTLRDAARRDLERTLADIAAVGYKDVEMLDSMGNFGMPAGRLRQTLDRVGLRAPSTHVAFEWLRADLDRHLDDAATVGYEYVIVASLPAAETRTLDGYRALADELNRIGAVTRRRNVWVGFHNHADDFRPKDGGVPYDVFVERTDPALVRHQLDTGNLAAAGRDPLDYLARYGDRYWQFHIKDAARPPQTGDGELGTGTLDIRRILARIDHIERKHLYVEQEVYPGDPLESARRDYEYLARLEY